MSSQHIKQRKTFTSKKQSIFAKCQLKLSWFTLPVTHLQHSFFSGVLSFCCPVIHSHLVSDADPPLLSSCPAYLLNCVPCHYLSSQHLDHSSIFLPDCIVSFLLFLSSVAFHFLPVLICFYILDFLPLLILEKSLSYRPVFDNIFVLFNLIKVTINLALKVTGNFFKFGTIGHLGSIISGPDFGGQGHRDLRYVNSCESYIRGTPWGNISNLSQRPLGLRDEIIRF